MSRPIEQKVEGLMHDKKALDAYIYTPWREAVSALDERMHDPLIEAYVKERWPEPLFERKKGEKRMVFFRQVATPNFEMFRFLQAANALTSLSPCIYEFTEDKFVDMNSTKHALGKMCFYKGRNKKGDPIVEQRSVFNMNHANGKPFNSLYTNWGQPVVEFHHELLFGKRPDIQKCLFDFSDILRSFGDSASAYYKNLLSLFVRNAILFENFLLTEEEEELMSKTILPAFMEIEAETGKKPLIVHLGPADQEHEPFWTWYPADILQTVNSKLER